MRSRRGTFSKESSELKEINISPLIDVVFILLIFFIVTTVFIKDHHLDIERPEAQSSKAIEMTPLWLSIDAEGRVFQQEREIGLRGVRAAVQRALGNDHKGVVIQVDQRASIESYVQVHDMAISAGAEHVSMATASEGR